jgi:hypothetical protein
LPEPWCSRCLWKVPMPVSSSAWPAVKLAAMDNSVDGHTF